MIARAYAVSCDGCFEMAEMLGSPTSARSSAAKAGWSEEPVRRGDGRLVLEHKCPACRAKAATAEEPS